MIGAAIPGDARAAVLSAKRGFADVGAYYGNLQATGAGWYYTWGTGAANPGNFDAKHYPMFWGGTPSQGAIDNVKARNPEYVLGFNEPERPDQANMTVAQAIAAWTPLSNSFTGTSTKLVSPAVADTGGAGGGQQWLANFMSQAAANNLKVDAVAFHWYGVSNPNNPAGAASSFLSRVDSYFNSYGKPVFITEFAIHDWGGAYTDEQIIEANRQFLNIVIPGLESRAHVAGYAWYHWFTDAHLYEGNPPTPTTMGHRYVGAVMTGATEDIGGKNLGEHVAYLAGGTLTQTGAAASMKYVNALANTSTITGGIDWGLSAASTSNWVRVQSGATLRKAGTNTITFGGGGTITNDGVIEIADGVLRVGAMTGSGGGSIVIPSNGGATGSTARLELTGNVNLPHAITFAQRNDPGGSDGIRNISGNNTLSGPLTITVGGSAARVRSDAGLLTLGSITTNANAARNLFLQGAGNGVVGGAVADNAADPNGKINLTKDGAGTWTLRGANTYTGTTAVNAGTLAFAAAPSNIGSVTVANDAGLRVGAAGPDTTALTAATVTLGTTGPTSLAFDFDSIDTIAPLIATGAFTANGTVNVTMHNGGALNAGTHKLVGYTSFAGGGTFAGAPFALGPRSTGSLINNGVNALDLVVTADRPIWTGADNGNWVAGTTGANRNWKLQSAATTTDYLEGDNVLFDDSATGATTVNINAAHVAPAATTFNNSAAKTYTVTSSGGFGITGSGRVTKNGAGTVTLATANTYTGTTTINAGTLAISANNNLGADAAAVTLNGGTLRTTNSGRLTNTHAFTVAAGGGTINISSTGSAGSGQVFFNTPGTLLGDGPLTVTGTGTLTTTGAGNLRIGQANPYAGNVTLQSGGSFEYGVAGAVDDAATFTIANQGELIANNLTVPNNVTVGGGTNSVLSFANGSSGTYAGAITLNANAIAALRDWYNPAAVRGGTISGRITGTGGLTVNSGTGTGGLLTLSNAANNYAGGTTISASKVLAGASGALGTGAVTISGAGAQLQLASGVNLANALTINAGAGTAVQGVVYVPTADASATYSGAITINSAAASGGHFAANGGTLNVSGKVTSSVPVTSRLGTVVFSNTTSSYSQLQVQQGTVRLGAANAIPVGATVDIGLSGAAALDLGGFNQTLSAVTKNAGAATVTNSGAVAARLTTTGTYTYGGVLENGVGTLGLTVNGGAATLTGANTYSGGTTITAGTLRVGNNAALGTGAVALNGGTLTSVSSSGPEPTITNAIVAGGGNIAAGAGSQFRVNGNITGSAPLGLSGIFNSAGLRLGGNNAGYTGTATVTGANTRLAAAAAGSAAASWVVNGNLQTDVAGGATFHLGALSGAGNISGHAISASPAVSILTAGALSGSGNISGHAINASPAVSTLTVGALNANTTFAGTIVDNALNTAATGNADGAQNNVLALTKVGTGSLTLTGANTYTGATTAQAGRLVLGASLTTSSAVNAPGGTIELAASGGNRVIKTPTMAIGTSGRIDLQDNKLITDTPAGSFNGTNYTGLQGDVARAYNFGAWDQPGLTTSQEHAGQNAGVLSGTTTIGVATAEQVLFIGPGDTGTFMGQSVTSASTIAMYTYAGDLNFDGLVDGADYGVIDNSVQFPGVDGYANGDVNYDGVIDGADYGVIDNTIQLQGAPFPGVVFGGGASSSDASRSGVTVVPEPSACGFALLGAGALLARRRRRTV